jgi:hypothetical protein
MVRRSGSMCCSLAIGTSGACSKLTAHGPSSLAHLYPVQPISIWPGVSALTACSARPPPPLSNQFKVGNASSFSRIGRRLALPLLTQDYGLKRTQHHSPESGQRGPAPRPRGAPGRSSIRRALRLKQLVRGTQPKEVVVHIVPAAHELVLQLLRQSPRRIVLVSL